jgi:hypothetical protein
MPHCSEKKPCVLAELLVTKLLMDVWISTLNLPGSLREAFHQKPEDSFDRWAQRPTYGRNPSSSAAISHRAGGADLRCPVAGAGLRSDGIIPWEEPACADIQIDLFCGTGR